MTYGEGFGENRAVFVLAFDEQGWQGVGRFKESSD